MRNLLVSFSGGRTSAFMCKWLLESPKYKDYNKVFVFANTGKEREETLKFVNECDKKFKLNLYYVEAAINPTKGKGTTFNIVDFQSLDKEGKVFEDMIKVYGIPNVKQPHCTRELKTVPIHKFAKHIFKQDYYTAIGIRADEQHRINWASAKEKRYIYPLATDFRVDSKYIREFWQSMPFDLKLKDYEGNCNMCWKKSNRKLLTLILENPKMLNWWQDMEFIYGGFKNYTFFRGNNSAIDLIELSKKPFSKAIDLLELDNQQKQLFNFKLDQNESCFCS